MTCSGTIRPTAGAAALLCAIACGGTDQEGAFPSRDWSGPYAVRAVESSTDCLGAEAPPPLGDLVFDVRQTIGNEASLGIGPLISLTGRFEGDELEAAGEITQGLELPDSLIARASAIDSLETIAYRLAAKFAGDSLRGRYLIRAPDLVALARGSGKHRCEYVYELLGVPLIDSRAAERRPAEGGPGEPR